MALESVTIRHPGTANVGEASSEIDLATETLVIPVKLCSLPPLNAVANQVLTLSGDPDIDLRQLSSIIRRDPAFAADVLFLANSSLFGFPQRMQSLRHAIAILGLDRIRALAVTVAMRGFVGPANPLVRQCWQHSVACALICEQIAPIFGVTREVAYTLGLMHDVGLLGFVRCYPKDIGLVLTETFETIEQVLAAERAFLKVDHLRAGAWLTKSWSLPSPFMECCQRHHDPFSPQDAELLKVVKVGCRIADALKFVAFKYQNSLRYDNLVLSLESDLQREMFPSEEELGAVVGAKLAMFL